MKPKLKENTMSDLIPDPNVKPTKRTRDNLGPLLDMLNDPKVTGAALPDDEATPPPGDPIFDATPGKLAFADLPKIAQAAKAVLDSAFRKKPLVSRVFTTGRMKVGKDFLLESAAFEILAFADPLYALARYFFGEQPKDLTRAFLQETGQIGRGEVSAAYPLSAGRATFISMIRSLADAGAFGSFRMDVDYSRFGLDKDIWLNALIARAGEVNPLRAGITRIGVSGCRFQNEFDRLKAEGFVHFHIMCAPATWLLRLKKVGLDPSSPIVKDVSEILAAGLDAAVYRTIARQRTGPKLRVVWSDEVVRPPSPRLLTVEEFKREIGL